MDRGQLVPVGVGRNIGSAARGSKTREASEPHFSEIVVTKVLDKATTKLFTEAVAGDLSKTVKFKFTTTTKDKVDTYLAFELSDCACSSLTMSASTRRYSDGEPLDQLHQGHVYLHGTRRKGGRRSRHRPVRYDANDEQTLTEIRVSCHEGPGAPLPGPVACHPGGRIARWP